MRDLIRHIVLGGAHYSGTARLAGRFLSGSGVILMLHRVNRREPLPLRLNDHLSVRPEFLDALIARMLGDDYVFVPMDEVVERLQTGDGSKKFAAITLDDAYLDNLTDALPVFERHNTPFTVYVAPGLTQGDVVPWWEAIEELVAARPSVELPGEGGGSIELDCSTIAAKRASGHSLLKHFTTAVAEDAQQDLLKRIGADAIARSAGRRFMDWGELRWLSRHRLATLGAHTVNHYNLKRLPPQEALRQMQMSAQILREETGSKAVHFAYPYGYPAAAGEREARLAAQAGFASAVTTRHGMIWPAHGAHLHALPRLSLNGRYQNVEQVFAMLSGLTAVMANRGRRLVTV